MHYGSFPNLIPSFLLIFCVRTQQDIYKQWDTLVAVEDKPIIEAYVRGLQSRKVKTPKDVEKALNAMRREFKGRRRADGSVQDPPRKSEIIQVCREYFVDLNLSAILLACSMRLWPTITAG
jgi:hypothetical protein